MRQRPTDARTRRRRGAAAVYVVVVLPVLFGFAALTIDVGMMFNARADLQNTADAGALSAAGKLRSLIYRDGAVEDARAAAITVVERNTVLARKVTVDPKSDIVFGRAIFDQNANESMFFATEIRPNAARVTVRHTKDSPNGALPLYFANIFGRSATNVSASAVAAMVGARDIAVTIDLSGSMKHDSYLRFHDVTQINARDIWAALDGPPPSRPYIPGPEHKTEYAFDSGPTIGVMDTWGDPIDPALYDATTDPGLWYIPRGEKCDITAIRTSLVARGYSPAQVDTVMGSGNDWSNRVAVMIGLAEWMPSGAADTDLDDGELKWIPYPPYRKDWVWSEYVGWAGEPDSKLTRVHPQFQYRFGVKTYVDFLLDRKDNFSQTDLTATPEEPLTAVKDGIQAMVDMSSQFDQMSLEVFGSTGVHEMDLTDDRQAVADRLYEMQA
ncbi:MAG: pilus assembly protein TadG-related protein [Phycisphaerae bacterium]|jgi:Flp pilus assembly protein TadG